MEQREVLVLGHRGMLGHTVARCLRENGFTVITTQARFSGAEDDQLIAEVLAVPTAAVVNCIGQLGKRRVEGAGGAELFLTNALLPQRLAAAMGGRRTLVHASSDGVFDGNKGSYGCDDVPDATDPYGVSKQLGELAVHRGRVVVLRCSIVGLDASGGRGLLSWFLRQNGPIPGYTNHRWNGITTLQWARLATRALLDDPALRPGIHQPACAQPITKHELLATAAAVFDHRIEVIPRQADQPIDRTLTPTITCPSFGAQLDELRTWYAAGHGANIGAPPASC